MSIALLLLLALAALLVLQRRQSVRVARDNAPSEVWQSDALAICGAETEFCKAGAARRSARFDIRFFPAAARRRGAAQGAMIRAVSTIPADWMGMKCRCAASG
jgi:hypothetical protein